MCTSRRGLKDGIIVEGCKVHISEASVADEVLVLPTRALRTEDKDYAVAFAVPGDWDGLTQVMTHSQSAGTRTLQTRIYAGCDRFLHDL